jgi:hypothetical protein
MPSNSGVFEWLVNLLREFDQRWMVWMMIGSSFTDKK